MSNSIPPDDKSDDKPAAARVDAPAGSSSSRASKSRTQSNAVDRPGALLRAARQSVGQSREEVARALCLSQWQLDALESDEYSKLFGQTYIVGYWRSYANLLGINIDAAIAAHQHTLPGASADLAPHTRQHAPQQRQQRSFALSCLLAAAVLFGVIWLLQSPSQSPSAASVDDAPIADALAPTWSDDAQPRDDAELTLPAGSAALPQPNFSVDRRFGARAANAEDEAEWRGFLLHGDEQNGVADDPIDPANQASADAAKADGDGVAADDANQLTLNVGEDTWVEVSDVANTRLLYEMVEGGRRLTVRGQRPFSVFIGTAANVRVEYLGKEVPVATNGGLFARFQIGAPQIGAP